MIVELIIYLFYILVSLAIGLATALVVYARWYYGKLERIPGLHAVVKPAFIGGSETRVHKKVVQFNDNSNVKKYGKVYGYYEGREPQIFVADADILRQIFIKDFDHFHNKRQLDCGHELINDMMDLLPYAKWKPVRNFLSPILSTGKIKNMSVAMSEAIEDWTATVKEKMAGSGNVYFEPKKMFVALTSDVIARCGFATKLNSLHDPDNIFVQNLRKIFHEDSEKNYMLPLVQTFPFLMKGSPIIPADALEFFAGVLETVMKTRRANKAKINDFVDTLNDMMDKVETDPEWKSLKITKGTVISQAMVFFIAAFKTVSTALSLFSYTLAIHLETQDKVIEELDAYLARNKGKISHETINELVFMSACMNETLRLHPAVIRLERVCNKNWKHQESGLEIPKDMTVMAPVWAIHHSEEYYENANAFKPERFMPENKDKLNQYANLSFGLGPHNCVGSRFAKEEVLFAMANLLKHFKIRANAKTQLDFFGGSTFIIAVKPFAVDLVKRN